MFHTLCRPYRPERQSCCSNESHRDGACACMETTVISEAAGTWRAPLSAEDSSCNLTLLSCLFLYSSVCFYFNSLYSTPSMAFTYQVNTSIEINAPPEVVRRTASLAASGHRSTRMSNLTAYTISYLTSHPSLNGHPLTSRTSK